VPSTAFEHWAPGSRAAACRLSADRAEAPRARQGLLLDIRRKQGELQAAHKRSKMVTRTDDMKRVRDQMQDDITEVGRIAHKAKGRLEALDKANEAAQRKAVRAAASGRTQARHAPGSGACLCTAVCDPAANRAWMRRGQRRHSAEEGQRGRAAHGGAGRRLRGVSEQASARGCAARGCRRSAARCTSTGC